MAPLDSTPPDFADQFRDGGSNLTSCNRMNRDGTAVPSIYGDVRNVLSAMLGQPTAPTMSQKIAAIGRVPSTT